MVGDLTEGTEYEVVAQTVLVEDKIQSKQSSPLFFTTNSPSSPVGGKGICDLV